MSPVYSINFRKRFVNDMNLPIAIFEEPYFSYFLKLYESYFQSLTKWNNICDLIKSSFADNDDLFLKEYYRVRDKIITDILESDSYKEFNNMDMSMYQIKNYGFPSGNVYNEINNNQKFISIDLKKANFQALRLVNVIKDETYDDFVSRYTNIQYIKESKYTRQVMFGKLNAKRQITVEKYIVSLIYEALMDNNMFSQLVKEVKSFASDEIIFSISPNLDDQIVNETIKGLSAYIKGELGYFVDVEYFVLNLKRFYTYNDLRINAFIKHFLNLEKKNEIMSVPMFYYAQIYKALNNLPIEENDLLFLMEGQVSKFLNPLKFE